MPNLRKALDVSSKHKFMSFLKNIFTKSPKAAKETDATHPIFQTHKDKIYPWVKVIFNDGTPAQIELKGEDELVSRQWLGDLIISYAFDMGDRFQLIHKRDLPKDVTDEQLHQIAVENLGRDIEYKLHDTNFGAHGLIAGGNHEAGSICLSGIWDWLAEHLNDNLIVAIPAKDLVMMVPEKDPDKINNLKIFVHQIFQKGEKLLTRNIFKFDRGTKEWTIVENVS
jgi:uncharacterized protein YtpQ (UPF0354 family)